MCKREIDKEGKNVRIQKWRGKGEGREREGSGKVKDVAGKGMDGTEEKE